MLTGKGSVLLPETEKTSHHHKSSHSSHSRSQEDGSHQKSHHKKSRKSDHGSRSEDEHSHHKSHHRKSSHHDQSNNSRSSEENTPPDQKAIAKKENKTEKQTNSLTDSLEDLKKGVTGAVKALTSSLGDKFATQQGKEEQKKHVPGQSTFAQENIDSHKLKTTETDNGNAFKTKFADFKQNFIGILSNFYEFLATWVPGFRLAGTASTAWFSGAWSNAKDMVGQATQGAHDVVHGKNTSAEQHKNITSDTLVDLKTAASKILPKKKKHLDEPEDQGCCTWMKGYCPTWVSGSSTPSTKKPTEKTITLSFKNKIL